MSYVVVYRAGSGRGAPVRRYTISAVGKITPDRARTRAKAILGSVAHGNDSAGQKSTERGVPTVAGLADRFMAEHIDPKRKGSTAAFYRDILERLLKPAVGTTKADKLTRLQVGKLHSSLSSTPFQANRVLAAVSWDRKVSGEPAERFLNGDELVRLGRAIEEAETSRIVDCGHLQTDCQASSETCQSSDKNQLVCRSGGPASPFHRVQAARNSQSEMGIR